MPGSNPRYPLEFKEEAVQLVHSSDRSIPQIAKELGVSEGSLRNWLKQAEIDEGKREELTTQQRQELKKLRKKVQALRQEKEEILKSNSLFRRGEWDPVSCYRFIDSQRTNFPVPLMCRVLGVSRSGYYAWKDRPPSRKSQEDAVLTTKIREIYEGSRRTYGAPRIHAALREMGICCAKKRVARLMRKEGLRGLSGGQ